MFDELFAKRGLSLDRLRSFLAIAEAGSIAKAAPDDLVRQGQFSRQIRELEEFFGTELTRRRGKTLSLSPAGQRLAHLIRQQLQDLDDFRREQHHLKKSFVIGSGSSVLEWLVVPVLQDIQARLGGASLRLEAMRSRELVEAVRDGTLDFAVVRQDALAEAQQTKASLKVISMSFHLCGASQLIGSANKAKLADPQGWERLPWATLAGEGQLGESVRKALDVACSSLTPAVECTSLLQVKELVIRGVCVGVLPSMGMTGLLEAGVISCEFAPLKNYGRPLVLHWNERQMRRRGVAETGIRALAKALRVS